AGRQRNIGPGHPISSGSSRAEGSTPSGRLRVVRVRFSQQLRPFRPASHGAPAPLAGSARPAAPPGRGLPRRRPLFLPGIFGLAGGGERLPAYELQPHARPEAAQERFGLFARNTPTGSRYAIRVATRAIRPGASSGRALPLEEPFLCPRDVGPERPP